MSQKTISVGTVGTPADLDTNFSNAQDNFTELYSDKGTQDAAIALNTAKVGITTAQANAIIANTAKVSFDSTSSARLANTSGTNTGDQSLSGLVATTGNETIAGIKTFSSSPIVPTPTTDMQASTKKYVDDTVTLAGGYTDEQAQDAVGAMVTGNTETGIAVTYDDASGKLNFAVDAAPTDATITTTDVTTNNASTTKHGWAPKATAPGAGLRSVLAIDNGETVRTDKALFDATSPAAETSGASAVVGTAMTAARRDHVHAMPTIPTAASLSVDDLITLSGVAEGSVTLGTFTGSTIADSSTVKAALQALETAIGGASGLTSLPTADNQILQATGAGTYAWSSSVEGLINDAGPLMCCLPPRLILG
jgi:hypothetical protein